MNLEIAPTPLCSETQQIEIDKVAALIGENGSGKSLILQSVFEGKIQGNGHKSLRVVSFSSGQNESFSSAFSAYLTKKRRAGNQLNLDSFYFDKSWSKLLIFLATATRSRGYVRSFLKENDYIEEETSTSNPVDESTTLTIKFQIPKHYCQRIDDALLREEKGEVDTIRQSSFHRSLSSFVQKRVYSNYDFERPIRTKHVELSGRNLLSMSFADVPQDEEREKTRLSDPVLSFFTQAADNNYFLDPNQSTLKFKDDLELGQLSDGEYQLLFLYALLDLFDSEDTLFLFDEADSHLHYQNVDRFWTILKGIKGHALTTTHLLDSITSHDLSAIQVVENGRISNVDKVRKLIERLKVLSRAKSVEFQVCAKIKNIALLDDFNDWKIFLLLAERKGLDISLLKPVCPLKKESSYATENETMGGAKFNWLGDYSKSDNQILTSSIFLICDCDNAPLHFKANGVEIAGQKHSDKLKSVKWPGNLAVKSYLLAWKRREIKNYLLSFTALTGANALETINNEKLAGIHHLSEGDPGDNKGIRGLIAKPAVDPLINGPEGLCPVKLQDYVNTIPPAEISEDIEKMFTFISERIT